MRTASVGMDKLVVDCSVVINAYQRTLYDSLYLTLSLREGCSLVTADERLVKALAPHFPHVIWLAKWV